MQLEEDRVALKTRKLIYPKAGVSVKLLVPEIEAAVEKPTGNVPFTYYFQQHHDFRRHAQPAAAMLQKKAMKDLKGIEGTFPMLRRASTILAMAAWFVCLCTVDDMVESMDPVTAEKTLEDCCELLRRTRIVSMSHIGDLDAASCQDKRRSMCYTVDKERQRQTVHVVAVFRAHLLALLGNRQYQMVSKDVSDVLWAIRSEINYRQTRCSNVSEYMQIRAFTIGLAPFFTLLRLDQGISVEGPAILTAVEGFVKRIIGMHNDLVGLERDVKSWEWMNYAVVYTGFRERQPTSLNAVQDGILRAISVNDDFARLLCIYSATMIPKLDEREARVAYAMVAVIRFHFHWATSTKRYKA